MSEFSPGQRWLSETETELGLGIVQHADYRLVTIFYPACEEERTYSKTNPPLSRITFSIGDTIETVKKQKLVVTDTEEVNGLMVYLAHPEDQPDSLFPVPEIQLNHHLDLSSAAERLFARQLDHNKWFELRYQALKAKSQAQNSIIKGLRGPRIDLIPHQLYIAHEVGLRHAPRVLLSDEVGLGKTIEAGLIIHQQLQTQRAQRVLIVVPPTLVHQWFVEMIRRFNLHFSIFDESRVSALQHDMAELDHLFDLDDEDASHADAPELAPVNPFLSEQLILCSTDFLASCEQQGLMTQLCEAEWDLLVVDEAHHLEWHPEKPGPDYQRIERLAHTTKGLLLLTATPEQLGRESHFARLRLLDPDRYNSLENFYQEQRQYQKVASLAAALHDLEHWPEDIKAEAATQLPDIEIEESNREAILKALIDRSGTGRVQFRNTRKNISGFPQRSLHPVPLPVPALYSPASTGDAEEHDLSSLLHPESLYQDDRWCSADTRVEWLTHFLKQHRSDKVLVICARKETAIDLHAYCNYKLGMNAGVFHEHMDLIERDRAAAWFADMHDGAQVLFCSEIGSEGRNFQFSHQLVLFDLPHNPDLLEQRIGRLDRIGQTHTINIHVPYFTQHPQETLFHWYHEGMNAFEHTNPAGIAILKESKALLLEALHAPDDEKTQALLITQTRETSHQIKETLETGRDRLLELSSFDQQQADLLISQLCESDASTPSAFMEQVFEHYGVDSEFHSEHAHILKPSEHMVSPFPALPDEGVTVTDNRSLALSRDDMQFLTWEHPMVTGAIDLILSEPVGKASVALLKNKKVKTGTMLVEVLYSLECVAPGYLQAQRYLPNTLIRYLIDSNGKDLSHAISHEALSQQCHKMDKNLARKVVSSQKPLLENLLKTHQVLADEHAAPIIQDALDMMQKQQHNEISRMRRLAASNPGIRQEEIDFMTQQTDALSTHLKDSRCTMEAVRIIVAAD